MFWTSRGSSSLTTTFTLYHFILLCLWELLQKNLDIMHIVCSKCLYDTCKRWTWLRWVFVSIYSLYIYIYVYIYIHINITCWNAFAFIKSSIDWLRQLWFNSVNKFQYEKKQKHLVYFDFFRVMDGSWVLSCYSKQRWQLWTCCFCGKFRS